MYSIEISHSTGTGSRANGTRTQLALTLILILGLGLSPATFFPASGRLWAAPEPHIICGGADLRGNFKKHDGSAPSRHMEKLPSSGSPVASFLVNRASTSLSSAPGTHRDRTTASLPATFYPAWRRLPCPTDPFNETPRFSLVSLGAEAGIGRAQLPQGPCERSRQLIADCVLGRAGHSRQNPPFAPDADQPEEMMDPQSPAGVPPACRDTFGPDSCRSLKSSFGPGLVRGQTRARGENERHTLGAAPSNELFKPFWRKLSPYFRICTSDMITPVPFNVPGTRIKACAMACKCDDGAFGIGLYTTKRLTSLCSVAAESICPWQIKTISPSSPIGLTLPMQFTESQIVGCRLLESRPWE